MSKHLSKPKRKRKQIYNSKDNAKDNTNLNLKLEMRREYIDRYFPKQPIGVLETCAGEYGWIWSTLKKEYQVDRYMGIDQKPLTRGIIQGDAENLVLGINVNKFNVIDIDTYGLPWKILLNITKTFTSKAVVFLTIGNALDLRVLNNFERRCIGIPTDWNIPCNHKLFKKTIPYCLYEAQRKCVSSDINLYWHESVVGHGLVGYVCMYLDGTKNGVNDGGEKRCSRKGNKNVAKVQKTKEKEFPHKTPSGKWDEGME